MLTAVAVFAALLQAQVVTGQDCQTLATAGDCSFYSLCAERQLQCGASGYALNYGQFFCEAFETVSNQFNSQGRQWITSVRSCLMQAVLSSTHYVNGPSCTDKNKCCKDLKDFAFNSHPNCYVDNGFCSTVLLSSTNLKALYELFSNYPRGYMSDKTKTLDQIITTGTRCASKGANHIKDTLEGFIQNAVDDFKAFVNQIQMRFSTDCNRPIDMMIVMDSSGSIGADNFEAMKNFVSDLIRNFGDTSNLRVGVQIFSDTVDLVISLRTVTNKNDMTNSVQNIEYLSSGTATHLALDQMRHILSTLTPIRVGILLTDGQSNNEVLTAAAAKAVQDADIQMYTFGIGNSNPVELKLIASKPTRDYSFYIDSFDTSKFNELLQALTAQICTTPQLQKSNIAGSFQVRNREPVYLQYPFNKTGDSIDVNVKQGSVMGYGSFTVRNPGKTTSDFSFTVTSSKSHFVSAKDYEDSTGVSLTSRRKRQAPEDVGASYTLYVTIVGIDTSNTFNVTSVPWKAHTHTRTRTHTGCSQIVPSLRLVIALPSSRLLITWSVPATLPAEIEGFRIRVSPVGDERQRTSQPVQDLGSNARGAHINYSLSPAGSRFSVGVRIKMNGDLCGTASINVTAVGV